MRKSTLYICLTAIAMAVLILLIGVIPGRRQDPTESRLDRERMLVRSLQLTDISLFTEAPYTRHPSLADRFVPFQNHPLAISAFPSESLLPPPGHLLHAHPAIDSGGTP